MATKPTALIIDDEPDLLSLLSISLRRMGVASVKASNVETARRKLDQQEFELCLTDLRLPDGSGLEIIKHIQNQNRQTPIAVITAFGDPKTAVEALKSGAFDYVSKPIEVEQLERLVETALRVKVDSDPQPSDETAQILVGQSESIQNIRQLIAKVSRNQAPIHISGETGTGKEVIARLIHQSGPRHASPFVAVNCGAIPRELMESEFFGHKKGSFTGAHQDTEGLFRAAHGGTLFLDEIGDLSPELQVKLLRAIQEKKIRAVGDIEEKSIDVRLMSATNKNLNEMIESGQFREDFYYRINVIPIHAPSLRNRSSDIPLLVNQIIEKLSSPEDEIPKIDNDALEALCGYHFPGNIRELENILERTIALKDGLVIKKTDIILPQQEKNSEPSDDTEEQYSEQLYSELSIDEHVIQIEIDRIKQALEESNGNITAAAEALGTTFRSLRYRIKKLGINSN